MKRQTFVLKHTKEFRRFERVFIKDKDGKIDQRPITFTTEHKVSEKQRNTNARKIAAEFSTSDEKIYDALLRSHAYGKTFVLKDDPEGKLKKEPFSVTPVDAEKIALKNLFEQADLKFDATKSNDVLRQEYNIAMGAKTGRKIGESTASNIQHNPVDVGKGIQDAVDSAKKAYEEKYGEPIPEEFENDKAFLSALSDPGFDAKAYMEKASKPGESIESLREKYKELKGSNVPNPKKNDLAWIKKEVESLSNPSE